MFFKLLSKAISVVILGTFLFTNTIYANPDSKSLFKNKKVDYQKLSGKNERIVQKKKIILNGEDAAQSESQKKEAQKILSSHLSDISLIHLPAELGRIVEVYQNPGQDNSKLIVHIQDLHTNPEAEYNLAKILELLLNDYKMGLVCSEGAVGTLDTKTIASFPDYSAREKVGRIFVNAGEFTGEEYLAITKYPELPIWGIENEDIYFKNIIDFNKIMKFSPQSQVFISQAKKASEELKKKIYTKELLELDQKEADYRAQKMETSDYINYLTTYTKKLNIAASNYKNIALLTKTIDREKTIDQLKVMNDSQNLLLNLQSALAAKSLRTDSDSLMAKVQLFKGQKISPFSFYSYLKDLANKHLKDDFTAKYPNLNDFVDYLAKTNSLDATRLFIELEDLSFEIKQALSRTDEQKTLVKALRNINFLEGFFNLKVSNEEMDYYLNNKDSHKVAFFESFLKPALKKYNINTFIDYNPGLIDSHLTELEEFYKVVKERDVAMVDNSLSEIEKRNSRVSALIAGGFHTKGITKLLRKKGYSYIVVSPYSKTDIDEANYHFLLSGQRKPIEELLNQLDVKEIINRFTPATLRVVLASNTQVIDHYNKKAAPVLAELTGMPLGQIIIQHGTDRATLLLSLNKGADIWRRSKHAYEIKLREDGTLVEKFVDTDGEVTFVKAINGTFNVAKKEDFRGKTLVVVKSVSGDIVVMAKNVTIAKEQRISQLQEVFKDSFEGRGNIRVTIDTGIEGEAQKVSYQDKDTIVSEFKFLDKEGKTRQGKLSLIYHRENDPQGLVPKDSFEITADINDFRFYRFGGWSMRLGYWDDNQLVGVMYDSLVELAERFNKFYAPAEKEIIKAKLASGETLTTAKADETATALASNFKVEGDLLSEQQKRIIQVQGKSKIEAAVVEDKAHMAKAIAGLIHDAIFEAHSKGEDAVIRMPADDIALSDKEGNPGVYDLLVEMEDINWADVTIFVLDEYGGISFDHHEFVYDNFLKPLQDKGRTPPVIYCLVDSEDVISDEAENFRYVTQLDRYKTLGIYSISASQYGETFNKLIRIARPNGPYKAHLGFYGLSQGTKTADRGVVDVSIIFSEEIVFDNQSISSTHRMGLSPRTIVSHAEKLGIQYQVWLTSEKIKELGVEGIKEAFDNGKISRAYAITTGMREILYETETNIVAGGDVDSIDVILTGPVDYQNPANYLRIHPRTLVIADRDSGKHLLKIAELVSGETLTTAKADETTTTVPASNEEKEQRITQLQDVFTDSFEGRGNIRVTIDTGIEGEAQKVSHQDKDTIVSEFKFLDKEGKTRQGKLLLIYHREDDPQGLVPKDSFEITADINDFRFYRFGGWSMRLGYWDDNQLVGVMYDSLVELAERFNKSYAPAEKEIIKAKLASGETLTTAKADETIISHLLWLLDAYRIRHRTEPTLQEVIAIYRAMLEIPGNSITVQTKPLYRGDASKKMTITKTKIAEWLKKIDSHDISLRTEIDLYAALLKYSNAREELDHFLDLDRNDIDSAI